MTILNKKSQQPHPANIINGKNSEEHIIFEL